jgi:N-acetylneuraminic acid mutarotase
MKRGRVFAGISVLLLLLGGDIAFGAPVTVNGDLQVADEPDSGVPAAVVFGDGTRQSTASSGTVTSVGSGFGLTGGPITKTGTLSVNTTVIQNRVTGTCSLGSFFGAINADGSVVCQSGANTGGTVTQVNSGTGLTGGPITTTGTLSVVFGGTGSASTVSKSDHTHNYDATYVNITGDTMTGPLLLPVNGLAAGTTQFVLSGGNVGIGTASPSQKLEVSGNVKISGTGNGLSFPDGTSQTTAGGGVPSGFMVLGETASPPAGYTYTGKSIDASWSAKASMPTARWSLMAVVVNNKIYAIGGGAGSTGLAVNEEYDPASNTWAAKANMPTPRYAAGVGVVNNKIYVIGGSSSVPFTSALTTNEEYDPLTNAWSPKLAVPVATAGPAAAVVNNKVYVIGGGNGAANLSHNQQYDPASNTWASKAPMPAGGRLASGGAAVNDKFYVIGGVTSVFVGTNEEYNPATNGWATKAPMPTAREINGSTLPVVNNRVYVIGGLGANSIILANNEEYNPAANTWTIKASMPTARRAPATTAFNNKIYAIGGTDSASPSSLPALSTNEEYAPTLLYVHKKN